MPLRHTCLIHPRPLPGPVAGGGLVPIHPLLPAVHVGAHTAPTAQVRPTRRHLPPPRTHSRRVLGRGAAVARRCTELLVFGADAVQAGCGLGRGCAGRLSGARSRVVHAVAAHGGQERGGGGHVRSGRRAAEVRFCKARSRLPLAGLGGPVLASRLLRPTSGVRPLGPAVRGGIRVPRHARQVGAERRPVRANPSSRGACSPAGFTTRRRRVVRGPVWTSPRQPARAPWRRGGVRHSRACRRSGSASIAFGRGYPPEVGCAGLRGLRWRGPTACTRRGLRRRGVLPHSQSTNPRLHIADSRLRLPELRGASGGAGERGELD